MPTPSIPSAPIFTAPITVRMATRSFALRRGALLALTFGLHAILIGGLALSDFIVVEVMKPPRAATEIPVHFVPPGPAGGGGGAKPAHPKPAAIDAPRLQPPPAKPVVFPLPPPSEPNPPAEALPGALDNPGPDGGVGDGQGGTGRGAGPAIGGGNGPGGPGPGGPGIGTSDDPYPEGHPEITPPVLIASSRVYPRYPELARKAGVQASVILLVVIDEKGRVGSIEVMSAQDTRYGFDLATVEAVKQWRYHPALLAGRPVAVQASITFEFSLSR
ncbi:MAG TPA: energy transducer TonB [Dongiaceae bacterium]|nr:energy transducer TonB [Dongiaceae bacterium]